MKDLIKKLIVQMGEDPDRPGLVHTPVRVEKSLQFLTQGYKQDIKKLINNAIYEDDCDDMVIVKDIEFYSMCEHHMLPFYGKCHIGYIPNGKIFGVSKLARIVDCYARRLQLQERLTNQIADTLMDILQPKGVAVVVEAEHLCMQMRGVQKRGTSVITSAMHGAFRKRPETRAEFMNLIK